MLLIGHTNSDRKLHFQNITEEMIETFSPEDIFDGYCLMEHMVTHYILIKDERKQEAQQFALDYREYLVDFALWEKLLKGRHATIPLHFAKLGKALALLEFK